MLISLIVVILKSHHCSISVFSAYLRPQYLPILFLPWLDHMHHRMCGDYWGMCWSSCRTTPGVCPKRVIFWPVTDLLTQIPQLMCSLLTAPTYTVRLPLCLICMRLLSPLGKPRGRLQYLLRLPHMAIGSIFLMSLV